MSEEELNEAMQYNLDYTEAMLSDELFGGNEVAEVKLLASEKAIKDLQQKVEQLENIRKEAIKLIEEDILGKKIENVNWDYDECYYSDMPVERVKNLLSILNKGDNKE